jgi:hypothetical protein
MTFNDGLGTYLRMWTDGTWVFICMSMRLQTLLIGYLIYLVIGWVIYRRRRRKKGK